MEANKGNDMERNKQINWTGIESTAEGFRHNLTGDRKLTASTAL